MSSPWDTIPPGKTFGTIMTGLLKLANTDTHEQYKQKMIQEYKDLYGTSKIENRQQFIDFMTSYIIKIGMEGDNNGSTNK